MNKIFIASPVFNGNEKKYLNECVDTGWVSSNGRFISEFEKEFAKFCGTKYALACSNGTVSLHLILKAMGIKNEDEIIMPALTYIATANAATYCGAKPIFVDSDFDTFNIDPNKIEEKITEKTKAIMPVHLYGLPCDMNPIIEIANKYEIPIIEDAAEAHGALYRGEKVGSFGLASSFSFFGNKIITCGEGGMITTDDDELYEKMKLLRGQAVSPQKKYWHVDVGYNYRMTNMQAAIGLAQLENIDWHIQQRLRIASLYRENFADFSEYICMQCEPEHMKSVSWMSNIILKDKVNKDRDFVMGQMEQMGIEPRPVFYPVNQMPPYLDESQQYPMAEKLAMRGISLPSHGLLTDEEVKYVCDRIKDIIMS